MTQRYAPQIADEEERLAARVIELADSIREVWLSQDNGIVETRGMAGESQED